MSVNVSVDTVTQPITVNSTSESISVDAQTVNVTVAGHGPAHALDDLSDVETDGATDGQALVYDSDTSRWGPGTIESGGGSPFVDLVATGQVALGDAAALGLVGSSPTEYAHVSLAATLDNDHDDPETFGAAIYEGLRLYSTIDPSADAANNTWYGINSRTYIDDDYTGAVNIVQGFRMQVGGGYGASGITQARGFDVTVNPTVQTGVIGAVDGIRFAANPAVEAWNDPNGYLYVYGASFSVQPFVGSGTPFGGDLVGVQASVDSSQMAGGTVDNLIGADLVVGIGLGATVTTAYGLRIASVSGATNNYAIHTGNGRVRFGDSVHIAKTSAPADADIATSEAAFWFDDTNGSPKLKIKARSADGSLVSGEVALA